MDKKLDKNEPAVDCRQLPRSQRPASLCSIISRALCCCCCCRNDNSVTDLKSSVVNNRGNGNEPDETSERSYVTDSSGYFIFSPRPSLHGPNSDSIIEEEHVLYINESVNTNTLFPTISEHASPIKEITCDDKEQREGNEDITVANIPVKDNTVEDITVEDITVEDITVKDIAAEHTTVEDIPVADIKENISNDDKDEEKSNEGPPTQKQLVLINTTAEVHDQQLKQIEGVNRDVSPIKSAEKGLYYSRDFLKQVVRNILAEGDQSHKPEETVQVCQATSISSKHVGLKSVETNLDMTIDSENGKKNYPKTSNDCKLDRKDSSVLTFMEKYKMPDNFDIEDHVRNNKYPYAGIASQLNENRSMKITDAHGNPVCFIRQGEKEFAEITAPTKPNLVAKLYDLYTYDNLANVNVIIGNQDIYCHLLVLQSYSQYFELRKGIKTYRLPPAHVSYEAFRYVYDWMMAGPYGIKTLKRKDIIEIYAAAKYLKIKILECQIISILTNAEEFTEERAFFVYKKTKNYDMFEIQDLMITRIKAFFLRLVGSLDFVELKLDDLVKFLSSDLIEANCEMEIFLAAVRWLRYDWKLRMHDLVYVMACVRFELIDHMQLTNLKTNSDNEEINYVLNYPMVQKMVNKGMTYFICKHLDDETKPNNREMRNKVDLVKARPRLFTGLNKVYRSYDDFLYYLRDCILIKEAEVECMLDAEESKTAIYNPDVNDLPPIELVGQDWYDSNRHIFGYSSDDDSSKSTIIDTKSNDSQYLSTTTVTCELTKHESSSHSDIIEPINDDSLEHKDQYNVLDEDTIEASDNGNTEQALQHTLSDLTENLTVDRSNENNRLVEENRGSNQTQVVNVYLCPPNANTNQYETVNIENITGSKQTQKVCVQAQNTPIMIEQRNGEFQTKTRIESHSDLSYDDNSVMKNEPGGGLTIPDLSVRPIYSRDMREPIKMPKAIEFEKGFSELDLKKPAMNTSTSSDSIGNVSNQPCLQTNTSTLISILPTTRTKSNKRIRVSKAKPILKHASAYSSQEFDTDHKDEPVKMKKMCLTRRARNLNKNRLNQKCENMEAQRVVSKPLFKSTHSTSSDSETGYSTRSKIPARNRMLLRKRSVLNLAEQLDCSKQRRSERKILNAVHRIPTAYKKTAKYYLKHSEIECDKVNRTAYRFSKILKDYHDAIPESLTDLMCSALEKTQSLTRNTMKSFEAYCYQRIGTVLPVQDLEDDVDLETWWDAVMIEVLDLKQKFRDIETYLDDIQNKYRPFYA